MKNTTMVDKKSSKKMTMVNEEKQRAENLEEDGNEKRRHFGSSNGNSNRFVTEA